MRSVFYILLVLVLIAIVAFVFGYLISAAAYETGTLHGAGLWLKAAAKP